MKINFRALMNNRGVIFGSGMTVGVILGYALFTLIKEKELQRAIDECNEMVDESVKQSEIATAALEEAQRYMREDAVKERNGSDLSLKIDEYKKLYSGEPYNYRAINPGRGATDPAEMVGPSEDDDDEGESDDENDSMCQSEDENSLVTDEFEEEIKEANYYAAERRKPKLIKEDTFEYDGRDIYDKIDLYYYVDDDVLASEDEEIIDNIEHTVGDCLDKFGFRNNDEGEIYVRNFYTMTDYRITKMFTAFGELQR